MLRKILISLILLILVAAGGLFGLLATNSDILIDRFHAYVEDSTGAPLLSDTTPEITLFPNRGLILGASSWELPDGTMKLSFSHAEVLISSHALFSGRFSIKRFTVEDLDLTLKIRRTLAEYLAMLPARLELRRELDELIASLLHSLGIAPDTISIPNGRITLIEPDGNTLTLAPFTVNANNVHPGTDTDLAIHTEVQGSAPAFHATLDLGCTALFTEDRATFTISKAQFAPESGFSFHKPLSLSGGMDYRFDEDTLALSDLQFQGPELIMKASGSIRSVAHMYRDSRQGEATLNLSLKGDPSHVATLLGRPLPFADKKIFSDLEFSSETRWSGGRLRLDKISGSMDGVTFTGSLENTFRPLALSGDIMLSGLSLSAYRGESRDDGLPASTWRTLGLARVPRLDLRISCSELNWDRIRISDFKTRLSGVDGDFELNPISGTFAGSPLTASLKAELKPSPKKEPLVSLNVSVPQADLATLSELLMDRSLLDGTGTLNAALSLSPEKGLPSLNGKGSLTSSSVETMAKILPMSSPLLNGLKIPRKFDRMLCAFHVKDGKASVNRFSLEAPRLSLTGKGKLDLPGKTIDATGSVTLSGTTILPVRLSGDWRAPEYSLDLDNVERPASIDIEIDLGLAKQLEKLISGKR